MERTQARRSGVKLSVFEKDESSPSATPKGLEKGPQFLRGQSGRFKGKGYRATKRVSCRRIPRAA